MSRAYSIVVAFPFRTTAPHRDVQRLFQDEVLRLLGHLATTGKGNTAGVVDVAVREVTPPRKGKLTSGQWGDHGRV